MGRGSRQSFWYYSVVEKIIILPDASPLYVNFEGPQASLREIDPRARLILTPAYKHLINLIESNKSKK